jgi:hypothetical protein
MRQPGDGVAVDRVRLAVEKRQRIPLVVRRREAGEPKRPRGALGAPVRVDRVLARGVVVDAEPALPAARRSRKNARSFAVTPRSWR